MEELERIKEQLITCVQSQMMNLQDVDAKELGEVIDMIKDLSETAYYCSIAEAMEDSKEEKELMAKMPRYYSMPMYYPPYKENMYYDGGNNGSGSGNSSNSGNSGGNTSSSGGSRSYDGRYMYARGGRRGFDNGQMYYEGNMMPIPYYEGTYPSEIRDFREGRSGMMRRTYMESKELHQGKEKKIQELEDYVRELGEDITEMIQDASPEEKQILAQKLSTLADKVQ